MHATPEGQFPASIRVRVPAGLPAALAVAARRHHKTSAEFARQAILEKLAAAGIELRGNGNIEIRAEE